MTVIFSWIECFRSVARDGVCRNYTTPPVFAAPKLGRVVSALVGRGARREWMPQVFAPALRKKVVPAL